jgi:hypothetical protein
MTFLRGSSKAQLYVTGIVILGNNHFHITLLSVINEQRRKRMNQLFFEKD